MSIFKGSCVALVTPFDENGINFKELERLIEWHIENKTDAILVCGTTGEASTMTLEERKSVIKFTVDKVNKRIPVLAGTGSNNTQASIDMSIWAEKTGVDMLLVITPYYNKTSNKGLYEHFKAINDAVKTPIMLYNVPSRTGMNITADMLLKLSKLNNITAIKEASGNFSQIAEMAALCGNKLDIYSGNDDQIIPLLSLGGAGVVSVLANVIPKETHEMCELFFNRKIQEACEMQLIYLHLINSLFMETNPIPVKTAMNLIGFNCGNLRLPLCNMDDNNLKKLKQTLLEYNLTK
ncbi:4-hydroxy-tetrahydrodipicolinate synthase [Clostridium tarantellae]|uniref:4-hydroxy-tetrahydrodipicolinate synthase n=1 Tax=Clostridium tarantellae TaxID=39493 RepID=A0A6I1MKI6_9CLOT|nr:4-hydroxy-tetrahydrodipicolinate synthase [Clostridium tarantellae]MPQ42647.1 4-hydroxy-tetrahydrodipicolinate synthase [Clostridium tarantellae]